MIDLHTHSTASDGSLSPAELVAYAKKKNLAAIALTDHDTVEGVEEALAAGAETGIEVVPGIEISAEYPDSTLHILGYYINFKDKSFLENISVLQSARSERNPRIIKNLQNMGMNITLQEVMKEAETGQVGRPHFAQVLFNKGYVKTTKQAFDKYLKKGARAYEDKFRLPPREAIACIRNAGGIPVLGHPSTLHCRSNAELESVVAGMVKNGLMGIEIYYPDHSEHKTKLYEQIAKKYDLLITGGSDFHGQIIKGLDLGTGRGNLNVPYSLLEKMKKAHPSLVMP
jgi:hypothetical protein